MQYRKVKSVRSFKKAINYASRCNNLDEKQAITTKSMELIEERPVAGFDRF